MKKIKLKTKKAASKRFKISGSGKVMRCSSGRRHLLEHKSPTNKRQKRGFVQVSDSDMAKIKTMFPGL